MGLLDTLRSKGLLSGQAALDFTRGGLMGATTDLLGYPVDMATMAMRPFGYNVEKPVGGSEWLAGLLTSPSGSKMETAGRVVGGMLTPGPEDVARMTGLLAPKKAPVREIFAGPKAQTADLAALDQAKRMLAEGADEADVWRKTGWWVNTPDGVPRFEISDALHNLRGDVHKLQAWEQVAPDAAAIDYGLAVEHPALFDAYPQIAKDRNLIIQSGRGSGWRAGEDIAVGVDDFDEFFRGRKLSHQSRNILSHETSHAIQDIENMGRGASVSPANAVPESAVQAIKMEVNSAGTLADDIANKMAENEQLWGTPTLSDRDFAEIAAMRAYHRSLGEVESRAVERRRTWGDTQRKLIPPWESYDVPLDQLIIRR